MTTLVCRKLPKTVFEKGMTPWNKGLKTSKENKAYKCKYCGKEFMSKTYINRVYCSHKCNTMAVTGEIRIDQTKSEIIGKRFGKLAVVEFAYRMKAVKDTHFYFLCQCDCGKRVVVEKNNLKTGHTKSCGCIGRNRKDAGIANSNYTYRQYKKNARDRGYEFKITEEQFRAITQQNCFYCDCPPRYIKKKCPTYNGSHYANGIDRIDNTKGYILDNCVPCCKICNNAKWGLPYNEFILWVKRISKNLKNEGVI